MSDDLVVDEDDGDDGVGYIELFVSWRPEPIAEVKVDLDEIADDPANRNYTKLEWLTPQLLLQIAEDLVDCDERGGDPRAVMQAWSELWSGPLGDDPEGGA